MAIVAGFVCFSVVAFLFVSFAIQAIEAFERKSAEALFLKEEVEINNIVSIFKGVRVAPPSVRLEGIRPLRLQSGANIAPVGGVDPQILTMEEAERLFKKAA